MSIYEQIQKDLLVAMKEKDEDKKRTLRFLKAAFLNAQTAIGAGAVLDAAAELNLVAKEIKQRRDTIAEYEKLGQGAATEPVKAEIAILESYLPAQLSEAELNKIISNTIAELKASSMKDMGAVMKAIGPQIAGKADTGKVSAIIKEKLSAK